MGAIRSDASNRGAREVTPGGDWLVASGAIIRAGFPGVKRCPSARMHLHSAKSAVSSFRKARNLRELMRARPRVWAHLLPSRSRPNLFAGD